MLFRSMVELAKYQAIELSGAAWQQVAWENANRLVNMGPE